MFEKDAEEHLKKDGTKTEQILNVLNEISPLKITLKQLPFILAMIQQTFQDGAEFGYNKANEWKYTENGDLPKEHGWYWVQYNNGTFDCLIVTNSLRFLDHHYSDVTDCIYAWKEIVLPNINED